MIPLVAAGAASIADVLVHRFSGSSSGAAGNAHLESHSFQKTLQRASASKAIMTPAEQQAASLSQRLLHTAEVESAISRQAPGTVLSVDVKSDGNVQLQTTNGAVAVQMLPQNRELAMQVYAASIAAGVQAPPVLSAALDPQQAQPVVRLSPGGMR
ncbi:MAG: hypothetical protein EBS01_02810 [Verrucomicrobia bacterium]|nr:hypothetical protein [Verrucomicrobiota bacterium]